MGRSPYFSLCPCCVVQNEASKNEQNKEMTRLKKQIDYWKEQAGLSPEQRDFVDMRDITDSRPAPSGENTPGAA